MHTVSVGLNCLRAGGLLENTWNMEPEAYGSSRPGGPLFLLGHSGQACKMCLAEGCAVLLATQSRYCQQHRLCAGHLKAPMVRRRNGGEELWRFCQQCGKLEPLAAFDDNKRSCRAQLARRRAGRLTPSSTAVRNNTRNDNAAGHTAAGSQGVVAAPTVAAVGGSPPSMAVHVPQPTPSLTTMQPEPQLPMQPLAEVHQGHGEVGAVPIDQQIMLLEQSTKLLQCELAYLQAWNDLRQQAGSAAYHQQQPQQQPCPAPVPAAVSVFTAAGAAPTAAMADPWPGSTCQSFSAGGPAVAQPQQAAAMAGSQAVMTASTGGWTAPVSAAHGAASSPSPSEHINPFDVAMRTMEFGSAPAKTASGLCGSPDVAVQFAAGPESYQRSSSARPTVSSRLAPVAALAAAGAAGAGAATPGQQHGQPPAPAAASGAVLSAAAQDSLLNLLRMNTDSLGALSEEDEKLADQMVTAIMAQSSVMSAAGMATCRDFPISQQRPVHIQHMFGSNRPGNPLHLSLGGATPPVQLLQHTPAAAVHVPAGFQTSFSSPFAAAQSGVFLAPPTALHGVSAAPVVSSAAAAAGCSSTVRLQGAAQGGQAAQTGQVADNMPADSPDTFSDMLEMVFLEAGGQASNGWAAACTGSAMQCD